MTNHLSITRQHSPRRRSIRRVPFYTSKFLIIILLSSWCCCTSSFSFSYSFISSHHSSIIHTKNKKTRIINSHSSNSNNLVRRCRRQSLFTVPPLKYKNLDDDEEELQVQMTDDIDTSTTTSSSSSTTTTSSSQRTMKPPSLSVVPLDSQDEWTELLTQTKTKTTTTTTTAAVATTVDPYIMRFKHEEEQYHSQNVDVDNIVLLDIMIDLPKSFFTKSSIAKNEKVKERLLSIEMFIGRVAMIMTVCVIVNEVILGIIF